jgi:hypothetical protein|tara:strand:+ start:268 stop:696 length:429 start_codon:yes stop_codon:yes gene_type:complete
MIKYILKCENKHEFESWFSNSSEYEKLRKKNLLECIFCKTLKVRKSIMSPNVINKKMKDKSSNSVIEKNKFIKVKKDLVNLRGYIEKNFDFVGKNFSKEVKSIYYDKKNKRNIYGTTTQEERKELQEEGIELTSIPWIKKEN